jgi:D-3-phosphoglycerate dehydrogenase / 2-oxoglutarate reductase
MTHWKVFCNDDLSLKKDALKEIESIAEVSYFPAKQDVLVENIQNYDAYYASGHVQATREVLDIAKKLKVIVSPSTGVDHIDVQYAKEKNIDVIHIAKEIDLLNGFTATAEHAWGLLLACIRQLPAAFDCAKNGYWARQRFTGFQLYKKTLGIIGLGRLGTMMASFGNGFNMNVIGCDIKDKNIQGVKQVSLDELLKSSDIITIHIHLTDNNREFISSELFNKMKRGVVLINTSRGAIIDENALLDNLNSGYVSAAGLDVINGEWNKNLYDHPLIKYAREHNNLVISPHIAGATVESIIGARVFIAKKLAEYIKERKS